MQPGDIDVCLGLDVGKSSHRACALDRDGDTTTTTPPRTGTTPAHAPRPRQDTTHPRHQTCLTNYIGTPQTNG